LDFRLKLADSKPIKCPVCGNAVLAATHKPFCSERCTNVDLHRWLTGGYVVPADDGPEDDELAKEDN
jgi:uncharacterized protein